MVAAPLSQPPVPREEQQRVLEPESQQAGDNEQEAQLQQGGRVYRAATRGWSAFTHFLAIVLLPSWYRSQAGSDDPKVLFLRMRIVLLALICYSLAALSVFNMVMQIVTLYDHYYWCFVIAVLAMWSLLCLVIRFCPFRNAKFMRSVVRWLGYGVLATFLLRFTSGLWMLGGELSCDCLFYLSLSLSRTYLIYPLPTAACMLLSELMLSHCLVSRSPDFHFIFTSSPLLGMYQLPSYENGKSIIFLYMSVSAVPSPCYFPEPAAPSMSSLLCPVFIPSPHLCFSSYPSCL